MPARVAAAMSPASAFALRPMMRGAGAAEPGASIARVASNPSMSGIWMSIKTRS
jgi:hypothetical protein